jgi:pimeloyl-ACP methyl ester carboxylesterase
MSSIAAAVNSTNVRNAAWLAWKRVSLGVAALIAPQRATHAAAKLFATPPRHAYTPREVELLATGTRFDVLAPDGRIAAWSFGEAGRPVVVLSHGWGGRGAQLRAFVPALVQEGYRVVLFDHIGHGSSEGREASIVHFIKDLGAVAAHLERDGARIAGMVSHSLGAAALGAWLNASGREMRVVLIAPPTSVARYSDYFARRLGIAESVRRAMQQHFEHRLGYRWSEFELPGSVAHVRAAALVLHDTDDGDVSVASGLALARAWPGAAFVATAGLGHRAILRDAAVVADTVDFIADRVRFAPPPRSGEATAYRAPAPIA